MGRGTVKKHMRGTKGLTMAFAIFLACLLFYRSYDSYNRIHSASIFNLSNGLSDTRITYDLVLEHTDVQAGPVSWAEQKELFEAVGAFVEEQQIQLVVTDTVMDPQGNYILNDYIQTNENDWIYERLRMTGGERLDLAGDQSGYLSSDPDDPAAVGTFSSYDHRYFRQQAETLRLHGLKELTGTENDSLLIFVDSAKNGQKLQNFIDTHHSDIARMQEVIVGGGTQDDIAQIYQGTEILLAAISGCAVLVLLCLYQMIKMKKEILIRKMHGQSAGRILSALCVNTLLLAYVCFALTLWLLWSWVIPADDSFYIDLQRDLIAFLGWVAVTMVLLAVLFYGIIRFTTQVKELKSEPSYAFLNFANRLLKLCLSVWMLVPFVTSLNSLVPAIQKYGYLRNQEEMLSKMVGFSFFHGRKEELQQLYADTLYFDMTDYAMGCDFASMLKTGMPMPETDFVPQPRLLVNQTYLNAFHYTFTATDGTHIDPDDLVGKTYLVPSSRSGEWTFDDGEVIEVQTTGTHVNLEPTQALYQIEDPILVVYDRYDTMMVNPAALYFYDHSYEQANVLVDAITEDTYRLHAVTGRINRAYDECGTIFLNAGSTFLICFLLYALFDLQFCLLRLSVRKKELALQYLHGKTRRERYGRLWGEQAVLYAAIALIAHLQAVPAALWLKFIVLLCVFDSLLMLWLIHRLQRQGAASMLKGGEIG